VAPPVIGSPGPQQHRATDSVELRLLAEDPDRPFTWSITGLPHGLTAHDNGTVNGSPTKEGTFEVVAAVTDRDGSTSSVTFTWTITEAPPPAPVPWMVAFWSGPDVLIHWSWPDDPDLIRAYELTAQPDGATVLVEDG